MKRLFTALFVLSVCIGARAQNQNNTPGRIHLIGGIYGDKGTQNSGYPTPQSRTTSSCDCDLDATLATGNTSGYSVHCGFVDVYEGTCHTQIHQNLIYLGNLGNSYTGAIICPVLTNDRNLRLPDWDGDICTIVSPVTTYVGDTTNQYSFAGNAAIGLVSGGTTVASLVRVGGTGLLGLKNGATAYGNVLMSDASDSGYVNSLPSERGQLVTHFTKNKVEVGSQGKEYATMDSFGFYLNYRGYIPVSITHADSAGAILMESHSRNITNLTSNATAPRNNQLPDNPGPLLVNDHLYNSQTVFAATTMTVPHSLTYIPLIINPTWHTSHPINWWVSATTATNFTITWTGAISGVLSADWSTAP